MAKSIKVRKLNGIANLMQSLGCDKGSVKMMHGMVLSAVKNKQEFIQVTNEAVLGFITQFEHRVAG